MKKKSTTKGDTCLQMSIVLESKYSNYKILRLRM